MKARRLILLFALLLAVIGLEVFLLSREDRQDLAEPPAATEPANTKGPVSQLFIPGGTASPSAEPGAENAPGVSPSPGALPELEPIVMTPVPGPDSTPAPSGQALPTPTATPAPTPAPTRAPTPAPTPTPPPTPSPTPAPTAVPSGTGTGQGSFSSSTGTSLNLTVSWAAFDNGDGTTLITVSGDIASNSLDLSALYSAASIDLAGYGVVCDTLGTYVAPGQSAVNHLFSTSFTVPTGTQGNMNVSWRYGGTYGGVQLPYINASGYVSTG